MNKLSLFSKIAIAISIYLLTIFSLFLIKDWFQKPNLAVIKYPITITSEFPKEIEFYKMVDSNINQKIDFSYRLFDPVMPMPVFSGSRFSNKVAITIDDGYRMDTRVIDLLEAYKIKCTVFLIGEWVEDNPEIVDRMDKLGWEVCNHTYSHRKFLTKMTDKEVIEDIERGQRAITRITHKVYPLFRPPWGEYDVRIITALADRGYHIIMWNNGPGGYNENDSKENQVRRVMTNLKPGDILLFHFGTFHVYDVMKALIPKIMDKGYEFTTISEMVRDLYAYSR
jgi:peptidoglycan/xylan/chitin deacetylase (PgdA/CDA1 family)